jgi:hypothetical protein
MKSHLPFVIPAAQGQVDIWGGTGMIPVFDLVAEGWYALFLCLKELVGTSR